MQKGQLSIDLLITLVIVVAVVLSMASIMLIYSESQERSTIQQQLQYTADKTADLITSTSALDDSNFYLETKILKVYYTDENKNYRGVYPAINILLPDSILNVSITIKGQKQDANAYFYKDTSTNVETSNAATNGSVVIKRAG